MTIKTEYYSLYIVLRFFRYLETPYTVYTLPAITEVDGIAPMDDHEFSEDQPGGFCMSQSELRALHGRGRTRPLRRGSGPLHQTLFVASGPDS